MGGTNGSLESGGDDSYLNITSLSFVDPALLNHYLDASIDSVTVTNSGSGYLSAPNIVAQGGNGINAS